MAKLKIMKIELAAAMEHSKEIMDLLQRKGVVELCDCEGNDVFGKLSTDSAVARLEKYLGVAQSALESLDKYVPRKKPLLSMLAPKKTMSVAEYNEKSNEADEILNRCYDINSLVRRHDEAKLSAVRVRALMDSLKPWTALDLPTAFRGTSTTAAFIGSFPLKLDRETLLTALASDLPELECVEAEVFFTSQSMSCVFVLCPRENADAVGAALRARGFVRPSDPTKHPPSVRMERYEAELDALALSAESSIEELNKYAFMAEKIEFAIDYFTLRIDKYNALNKLLMSNNSFLLTGYVAERDTEALKKELEENYCAAVSFSEPDEDDADCPTLIENNSFVAGVESVTEMYSTPSRVDVDPNPVMSIFYYVFFGLMLSDAGYGLVMTVAMLVAKKKFKLEKKMKKTVDMFLYCGISTLIWGTLFGSWFGDIVQVIASNFFHKEIGSIALWFEPVDDPMKMMLYSFLFGIIHLFVGLGVHFYQLWSSGKKLDALCDVIPVYLLVAGIAPIGASVIIDVSPVLMSFGKYFALAGAVLVVLTSGRSAKNIIGKLGGGLFGLYNVGSGYLSDILSYSRLLALGLSTGVIASVVNLLGTIPQNPIVKAVLLAVVFVFGHIVNIAINLIGTYVHTNRLQYVEFFSKFYEGGGRSFTPLKVNTKYFKFKEEINNV